MQLFECFLFEYISLHTGLASNRYDYMRFSVHLWLIPFMAHLWFTQVKWRSETVHLGELVQPHMIQSLLIGEFTILRTK